MRLTKIFIYRHDPGQRPKPHGAPQIVMMNAAVHTRAATCYALSSKINHLATSYLPIREDRLAAMELDPDQCRLSVSV